MKTLLDAEWKRIGKYAHHGINIPLASIHSQNSCGIGEFSDLPLMIDFCHATSMDTLQLLPVNDTGWDPSPYNMLSSCALNPVYLGLNALPYHSMSTESFKEFNKTKRISYQEVLTKKLEFLREYHSRYFSYFEKEESYQKFLLTFQWLKSYASFKVLKEKNWMKPWKEWDPKIKAEEDELSFYLFLQYLCYDQLKKARTYAEEKNIFLKGDLPILISLDSVDVWEAPYRFNLKLSAGAPPDMFNSKGQYWGFPIYEWAIHEKEGFQWWKERLKFAANFYHIYRIDHVVGFFRIWAIPRGNKPTKGMFIPPENGLMEAHGRNLLEVVIKHSHMLPIGEDLGSIPEKAHEILREFEVPGTKVFRWQTIPYDQYDPISLTTVSTHDSETLAMWWEDTHDEKLSHEKRLEILKENHATPSYFHINLLNEYLALFPDLIHHPDAEERINVPGYLLDTNWTYRYIPSLEDLNQHEDLKKMLRSIIQPV